MKPISENEVIMLLLGIGVLVFAIIFQKKIKRIYAWKILIISFYILITGWILTILEAFIWESFFNLFEHICYATSSLIFIIWSYKVKTRIKKENY